MAGKFWQKILKRKTLVFQSMKKTLEKRKNIESFTSLIKKNHFGMMPLVAPKTFRFSNENKSWITRLGQKLGLVSSVDPYGQKASEIRDVLIGKPSRNFFSLPSTESDKWVFPHKWLKKVNLLKIYTNSKNKIKLQKTHKEKNDLFLFEWYLLDGGEGYSGDIYIAVARSLESNNIVDLAVLLWPKFGDKFETLQNFNIKTRFFDITEKEGLSYTDRLGAIEQSVRVRNTLFNRIESMGIEKKISPIVYVASLPSFDAAMDIKNLLENKSFFEERIDENINFIYSPEMPHKKEFFWSSLLRNFMGQGDKLYFDMGHLYDRGTSVQRVSIVFLLKESVYKGHIFIAMNFLYQGGIADGMIIGLPYNGKNPEVLKAVDFKQKTNLFAKSEYGTNQAINERSELLNLINEALKKMNYNVLKEKDFDVLQS